MSEIFIHPTAIVSKSAKLGANVKIGPFSIIEDEVEIGDGTEIRSNVVIANGATLGKDNIICNGVVIATEPQDLKYAGEKTFVKIGDRNMIREFVTINRATPATYNTVVGNDCLIMAYAHVAHDCQLGDRIIMANATQLGGHVHVEDWVIFGGVVKVHQFSVVGCHAMIGADVKLAKDVPPYTLIGSNPPKVDNLNAIGLKRRGFTPEVIRSIENFYKVVLHSGLNNSAGLAKYKADNEQIIPEVQHCIEFIEGSQRGIYR
jgi:UDP-N-acetylglucosamine acyltransferase